MNYFNKSWVIMQELGIMSYQTAPKCKWPVLRDKILVKNCSKINHHCLLHNLKEINKICSTILTVSQVFIKWLLNLFQNQTLISDVTFSKTLFFPEVQPWWKDSKKEYKIPYQKYLHRMWKLRYWVHLIGDSKHGLVDLS